MRKNILDGYLAGKMGSHHFNLRFIHRYQVKRGTKTLATYKLDFQLLQKNIYKNDVTNVKMAFRKLKSKTKKQKRILVNDSNFKLYSTLIY